MAFTLRQLGPRQTNVLIMARDSREYLSSALIVGVGG